MDGDGSRPGLAALSVLSGMALFGLIDNFIRLAAPVGGLWQFHFLRAALALLVLWAVARARGIRLRPRRPGRVAARSVVSSIAMVIYFGCLGLLPIAQVVAGLFTAPIWVVIFSVALTGARVGPRRLGAVAVGFVGIVLALRPEVGSVTPLTLLPVLAGALYGLGNLATREWCDGEGTLTLLGGFFGAMMVWGAIGCAVLALWQPVVPEGAAGWPLRGWVAPWGIFGVMIVVQGVGSLLGVGLSIRAYQLAEATVVAVLENALLVFATLWAAILWGEVPDALGLLGLALVALAGTVIAARTGVPQPVREPA